MKIRLDPGAKRPERAHPEDAGLDLFSREEKVIPAGGSACFDTGVHMQLPEFIFNPAAGPAGRCVTAGFLKSKSGLNVNHGLTSEGVVDAGFRGSIIVKLYNHGTEPYTVHAGDKITQLVILPVLTPPLELVDELDDTDRGSCGFGSTGR